MRLRDINICMHYLEKLFFFFLSILLSCSSVEEADVWCQWFLKSNSHLRKCFILKYKRDKVVNPF